MNIATDKYSENYLIEKLTAAAREVTYEYVALDRNGRPIGRPEISGGKISYDSKAQVMRTFSGKVKKSQIINMESVDYRIIPYMCLKVNSDIIKWPLGCFLIDPSNNGADNAETISIKGYDYGKIAKDDKISTRFYISEGGVYTSYIMQLLGESYTDIIIPVSDKVKMGNKEWCIGTPRISIANELLEAINYTPIHFDESGTCISEEYVFPQMRTVQRKYIADEKSIILDGISTSSNAFDIANKYVRYTESADIAYMIATYVNENVMDPYSVINRGRIITDTATVSDIASQADLENYVKMVAINAMQATQTIQFSTLNMPGHGYRNCLYVECEQYGIAGRYIETAWEMELKTGGTMRHVCEKVINI